MLRRRVKRTEENMIIVVKVVKSRDEDEESKSERLSSYILLKALRGLDRWLATAPNP